jgi:hypothetical protein
VKMRCVAKGRSFSNDLVTKLSSQRTRADSSRPNVTNRWRARDNRATPVAEPIGAGYLRPSPSLVPTARRSANCARLYSVTTVR